MRMTKLATLLLWSVLFAPMAFADETGAKLFGEYCAACHGATGKGDGDMADVINVPSPNRAAALTEWRGLYAGKRTVASGN